MIMHRTRTSLVDSIVNEMDPNNKKCNKCGYGFYYIIGNGAHFDGFCTKRCRKKYNFNKRFIKNNKLVIKQATPQNVEENKRTVNNKKFFKPRKKDSSFI